MIIVSGGQTGVDRAAWDAAKTLGLKQTGWVPKGRLAEDGSISFNYQCIELSSKDYNARTEKNVLTSDATLILGFGPAKGGTLLTCQLCERHQTRYLFLDLDKISIQKAQQAAQRFLNQNHPSSLNIAGPRGSYRKDIYKTAYTFLVTLLKTYTENN